MTELFAFALGAIIAAVAVYLGWRMGYSQRTEESPPPFRETFEGEVLDFAVYPDQIADDS